MNPFSSDLECWSDSSSLWISNEDRYFFVRLSSDQTRIESIASPQKPGMDLNTSHYKKIPFAKLSPTLQKEIAQKVHHDATRYKTDFEKDHAVLVFGNLSDEMEYDERSPDQQIEALQRVWGEKNGPYIRYWN